VSGILLSRRFLLLGAAALAAARPLHAADLDCDGRERDYFSNRVLTNQDGQQLRFYEDVLRGRTVLVGWIFTACPDACPLLAARALAIADAAVAPAVAGTPPRIVHLTTDPRRDGPEPGGDHAPMVLVLDPQRGEVRRLLGLPAPEAIAAAVTVALDARRAGA